MNPSPRLNPLRRDLRSFAQGPFLILLLAVSGLYCAEDATSPGSGDIDVVFRVDDSAPRGGAADTLHLRVEGAALPLAESRALDTKAGLDFDLRLNEAEDLTVALWIESGDDFGRGIVALGEVGGVRVRAARTSTVEIELRNTVPTLREVQATAGDVEYTVHWSEVEGALGYELVETGPEGTRSWSETDTTRTFSLVAAAGETEPLVYRVRALLVRGASRYSDPQDFAIGGVRDLPFVVEIWPPVGGTAFPDTTRPRFTFDREMDWTSLQPGAVRMVESPSETLFPISPQGGGAVLTLEHSQPFRRGAIYRMELDPGLTDLAGRPFDQEPATPGLQGLVGSFSTEIYSPLLVTEVDPISGAGQIPISSQVRVRFNREVDVSTITDETVRIEDKTGSAVAADRTFDIGTLTLTVRPEFPLTYETNYSFEVSTGVLDLRGEPLDQDPETEIPVFEPFSSSFRTEDQPVGPRVVTVTPAPDERNHPTYDDLVVDFDRAINAATVTSPGTFRVRKLPVGASINGTLTANAEQTRFVFAPNGGFEQGVEYELDLSTGILDLGGVPLDQEPDVPGFQGWQSRFRAEENLQVESVDPADREERVALTASVVVELNLPADPASVSESSVVLVHDGGTVPLTRTLSGDGRTLTLDPVFDLLVFTDYTLELNEGLRTTIGSPLDQNVNLDGRQRFFSLFTTRPDSIPPRVLAVVPSPDAEGVDPEAIVEVEFSKPVLASSVNGATFLVRRFGGSSIGGFRDVAPDGMRATFTPSEPLELLREYEIEITTWVVDLFDVRLDQDPKEPERQGWTSRFRIDHERVPPQVVAVSPSDSLEDISALTTVEVLFNEAMDPSTLPGAFQLLAENGAPVSSAVVVAADSARATLTPSQPLGEDSWYRVVVTTSAADRWGNLLDQDPGTKEPDAFSSYFRTEPDRLGPFVLGVNPADGSSGVEPDIEPEIEFSEPVDELSLGGVRLFDGDELEVVLASRILVGPSTVRILPTGDLATSTGYRIEVNATVRDTSGNPFDQKPGTGEPDLFTSTFTTRDENVPPQVLTTVFEAEPPPQDTQPRIVFSEPMAAGSLDPGDVVLAPVRGDEVPISAVFVSAETLLVTPDDPLLASTSYLLTVAGVTDLVGNTLDQDPETPEADPYLRSFQTSDDTQPPRVSESFPVNGAEGVLPDVVIALTFDEPMMTTSFNDFHYQLVRVEGSLEIQADGDITWNEDQTIFYYTPSSPLSQGFNYRVRADFFLLDLAGNPLDQDPDTPVNEIFEMEFLVGDFPEVDFGPSVCSDTTWVQFDASATFDPDGSIELLWFQWGDGTETFVENPGPEDYVQSHQYPCLDFAGCDGLDNDGDGLIDEADCNESYRAILQARDDDNLWGADTSGVSFCALGALSVEPPDGATGVDTLLAEVTLEMSRGVADSSLTSDLFRLRLGGLLPVELDDLRFGDSPSQIVFVIGDTLLAERFYTVDVWEGVVDTNGRPFDQDPCTPEIDRFRATFTTMGPNRPPPALSEEP